ncbi:MAG: flavodoxin domain-containing protein [Thermoleophilia bacterium]|jgi:hypothetical protein|nr:flavodoxin domain-containing protein [Thermoleophilia bacterium]
MRAVVVYESLYGNTHQVAEAVGEGLRSGGAEVLVLAAQDAAGAIEEADLLVVGGPTHVHGLTSERTLQAAVDGAGKHPDDPAPDVSGPPMKTWLEQLPHGVGCRAAAFDTRMDKPRLITGSAAHGIAKRLRHHGYEVVGEEGSFLIHGGTGPLVDGELDRARAWGEGLVTAG